MNFMKSVDTFFRNPSHLTEKTPSAEKERKLMLTRLQVALAQSKNIVESKYLLWKALVGYEPHLRR